jgi:hypothetical protein
MILLKFQAPWFREANVDVNLFANFYNLLVSLDVVDFDVHSLNAFGNYFLNFNFDVIAINSNAFPTTNCE